MNVSPRQRAILLGLLGLGLGACASTAEDPEAWKAKVQEMGYRVAEPVESVPHFRIDGFNALDGSHVALYGGVSRRYLVTVDTPCLGLTSARRIAYSTSAGALTRFDHLLVHDGPRIDRCRIESIAALEKLPG